jgi:hypothetical protein
LTRLKPKAIELNWGPIPPSCSGPDGKFREETESERKRRRGQHDGDCVRSPKSPTTPMILQMKNGCERSMSSVRIGPCSREATRRCESSCCWIQNLGSGLSAARYSIGRSTPAMDQRAHGAGRRGNQTGDCGLRGASRVNPNQRIRVTPSSQRCGHSRRIVLPACVDCRLASSRSLLGRRPSRC